MTNIVRVDKSHNPGYVVVSNKLAEDDSLSFAARGMMLYLLSKPDNWTVRMSDLENEGAGMGRQATRTVFHELEQAGYVTRERKHDTGTGKWDWITTVYEVPELAPDNEQETEAQPVDDSSSDGRAIGGSPTDGSATDGSMVDIVSTETPNTHSKILPADADFKNGETELTTAMAGATRKQKKPPGPSQKAEALDTLPHQAVFSALADLCQIDLRTITKDQRGELNQVTGILRGDDVRATTRHIEGFGKWWYAEDWRGQQGQPPQPSFVRKEWGRFVAYCKAHSRKRSRRQHRPVRVQNPVTGKWETYG